MMFLLGTFVGLLVGCFLALKEEDAFLKLKEDLNCCLLDYYAGENPREILKTINYLVTTKHKIR